MDWGEGEIDATRQWARGSSDETDGYRSCLLGLGGRGQAGFATMPMPRWCTDGRASRQLFLFVGISWSVCSDPFALLVPFPFPNLAAAMSL